MNKQLICVLAGTCGATGTVLGGITPSFVGIGAISPGSFYSQPIGISGDGSTVVGQSRVSGAQYEAFVWTRATGIQGITDLPGGDVDGEFFRASHDGSVAVGHGNLQDGLSNNREAVRWTAAGGLQPLGFLSNSIGSRFSQAWGVSGDGQVVVGKGTSSTTTDGEAFRWTQAGGMQPLGVLGGSAGAWSEAHGANSDGMVVVGSSSYSPGSQGGAFKWTLATGMTALPKPAGWAATVSAGGVSPDGQFIFGHGYIQDFTLRTILWTPAGPTGLPIIPGSTYDFGTGMSADGRIVVGQYNSTAGELPYIWTQQDGMRDLRAYLTGVGLDLSGWTLTFVHGISDDGLTITGEGRDPAGHTEGWVAVVPGPGGLIAFAAFGAAASRRRR